MQSLKYTVNVYPEDKGGSCKITSLGVTEPSVPKCKSAEDLNNLSPEQKHALVISNMFDRVTKVYVKTGDLRWLEHIEAMLRYGEQ